MSLDMLGADYVGADDGGYASAKARIKAMVRVHQGLPAALKSKYQVRVDAIFGLMEKLDDTAEHGLKDLDGNTDYAGYAPKMIALADRADRVREDMIREKSAPPAAPAKPKSPKPQPKSDGPTAEDIEWARQNAPGAASPDMALVPSDGGALVAPRRDSGGGTPWWYWLVGAGAAALGGGAIYYATRRRRGLPPLPPVSTRKTLATPPPPRPTVIIPPAAKKTVLLSPTPPRRKESSGTSLLLRDEDILPTKGRGAPRSIDEYLPLVDPRDITPPSGLQVTDADFLADEDEGTRIVDPKIFRGGKPKRRK